jgi:dephospho-CoA kinase
MERGGLSRDEFMKRMKLQWTEEDKIHMADFIILNNASEEDLKKNTLEVFNQIF